MNTASLAQSAYRSQSDIAPSDRALEYRAFAKVTRALELAEHATDATQIAVRVRAVHDNGRLWSLIAQDVAKDDNKLSADLRAQLFYLAEYSLHHGRLALAGKGDLRALIDVNTTVMAGLRGTPSPAANTDGPQV
ncbi:MAG: flagellar biosynthesis regulator FlaF [Pseudomonadota bacterium]